MNTKIIDLDQPFLVILELDEESDPSVLSRAEIQIKEKLKDYNVEVIAVPPGISFKTLTTQGVYHREVFKEIEIEVFAKNEADLINRLSMISNMELKLSN